MTCPICQSPVTRQKPNDDRPMFVCTDYNGDYEVYDPDVYQYQCFANPEHSFYTTVKDQQ